MLKGPSASVQFGCRLRVWTQPFVPCGILFRYIGSECRPRIFFQIFRSSVIVVNSFADLDQTVLRSGIIMVQILQTLIFLGSVLS